VVTPVATLREFGSDAVRYWAASARLGTDTTFDPGQIKIGRRLAVKLLNVSKFVLAAVPQEGGGGAGQTAGRHPSSSSFVTEPLDLAMLSRLAGVTRQATVAFDGYEHARALELAEQFFWFFCDDYVELVKARAYGTHGAGPAASAVAALRLALSALLRLFAPFLPFVTEEVWSWWQPGSVHRAPWPGPSEFGPAGEAGGTRARAGELAAASGAIAAVRAAKSAAKLSMRAPVRELTVSAGEAELAALTAVLRDVQAAGQVASVQLRAAAGSPEYAVSL
jgi:valyl-tRNA synthetase